MALLTHFFIIIASFGISVTLNARTPMVAIGASESSKLGGSFGITRFYVSRQGHIVMCVQKETELFCPSIPLANFKAAPADSDLLPASPCPDSPGILSSTVLHCHQSILMPKFVPLRYS